MIRIIKILLIYTFISCLLYANKGDDSIYTTTETIKVISNRYETNFYSSPSSVYILDKSKINNTNGEKLSDVLKTVGGIFVKSYGNNSALKSISMNGLGSENVLILLNGVRINSYQNSQYDLSLISKSDIQNIEISYNGMSAAYGSDAVSGILNINTLIQNNKRNNSQPITLNLKAGYGSYNYKGFSASVSSVLNDFKGGISFSAERSVDDFLYYDENKVIKRRGNTDYNFNTLAANLNFNITDQTLMSFYSSLIDNDRGIPGTIASVYSAENRQSDKNWNNIFALNHLLSNNNKVELKFSYQNNLMKYLSPGIENSYYKNLAYNANIAFNHDGKVLGFQTGADLVRAKIFSNNILDNAETNQIALYFTSDVSLSSNVNIFPSIRLENFSSQGNTVISGRLGINLKPLEGYNLFIRSTVGNNYRSPTFNELYWINGGNPSLRPEKSLNIDGSIIYSFKIFSENSIEFKYSHIKSFDKIIWLPQNEYIWTPRNVLESLSDNFTINLCLLKKIGNHEFNLYADYSRAYSRKTSKEYESDPSFGKQLIYIPVESSKINLNYIYKSVEMNLFYTFLGKRFINSDNSAFLPGVDLLDGNISFKIDVFKYEIIPRLEINNILNSDYQIVAGYPVPLRNYKFSFQLIY